MSKKYYLVCDGCGERMEEDKEGRLRVGIKETLYAISLASVGIKYYKGAETKMLAGIGDDFCSLECFIKHLRREAGEFREY